MQVVPRTGDLTKLHPHQNAQNTQNPNRNRIHLFPSLSSCLLPNSLSPLSLHITFSFLLVSKNQPKLSLSSLSLSLLDKSRRFFLSQPIQLDIYSHSSWKFLFPLHYPHTTPPLFSRDSSLRYLFLSLWIFLRSSSFGQHEFLCFFSHGFHFPRSRSHHCHACLQHRSLSWLPPAEDFPSSLSFKFKFQESPPILLILRGKEKGKQEEEEGEIRR